MYFSVYGSIYHNSPGFKRKVALSGHLGTRKIQKIQILEKIQTSQKNLEKFQKIKTIKTSLLFHFEQFLGRFASLNKHFLFEFVKFWPKKIFSEKSEKITENHKHQ
jgi:hypothetical protein